MESEKLGSDLPRVSRLISGKVPHIISDQIESTREQIDAKLSQGFELHLCFLKLNESNRPGQSILLDSAVFCESATFGVGGS